MESQKSSASCGEFTWASTTTIAVKRHTQAKKGSDWEVEGKYLQQKKNSKYDEEFKLHRKIEGLS